MKRLLMMFAVAALLSRGVCLAGGWEDGWAAYDRGDYKAAIAAYKKAANQEHPWAQTMLGLMYKEGQGVARDYKQAFFWNRKAAEQGYAVAQYRLGLMYRNGQGVQQDYKQAVIWYRKAAEQGEVLAQMSLGAMYVLAQGVPQDYIEAHKCFNLAAANATDDKTRKTAMEFRDDVAKRMTPAQIAEAQRRANEWTLPVDTN